jgi:hypothetical protein
MTRASKVDPERDPARRRRTGASLRGRAARLALGPAAALWLGGGTGLLALAAGCTPTVAVQAPKEPITINMNIKIEHEIRVKVDRDLDALIANQKDLF